MGDDGVGLMQEGVDGLGWAAADEILQRGDELRLLGVHLGVKTHGKMPWITISATLPRA